MSFLLDGEQTERLKFRKILPSDFNDWVEFFKQPEAHQHWNEVILSPQQTCTDWYTRQHQRYQSDEGGMNALVEKSTGKLVGHCGLLKQTVDGVRELEIGYSLLPVFWGRGYATEAARKCKYFAFANRLAPSLISIISVTNAPSERVALNLGMLVDKKTVYKGNQVNIFRVHDPAHSLNS